MSLADGVPGLSRSRTHTPDTVVKAGMDVAVRPWELVFKPLPDGKYRYQGSGFDAVIHPDGRVEYHEKDGITLSLSAARQGDGNPNVKTFGLGLPNVEGLLDRAQDNDPHQHERTQFLERTRALREELSQHKREAALADADRKLERTLKRIWLSEDRERLARQQAETFALWDECADDEVGERLRVQIERFIRSRCPEDSTCAFHEADLARLNTQRQSGRAFAPYGAKEVVPDRHEVEVRSTREKR